MSINQICHLLKELDDDLIEMVTYYIDPILLDYYLNQLQKSLNDRFSHLSFLRVDHLSTKNSASTRDDDVCYFYHQYLLIHQLDDFLIDPLTGLEWSILHSYHQLAKFFFHYHLYLTNKYPGLKLDSNLAPIWELALIHQEKEILELFIQNYRLLNEYKEILNPLPLTATKEPSYHFLFINTLHRGFEILEDVKLVSHGNQSRRLLTKEDKQQLDLTTRMSIKLLKLNKIDTTEKLFKSKEILTALLLIDPRRVMELTKQWKLYLGITVKMLVIKGSLTLLKEVFPIYLDSVKLEFKSLNIPHINNEDVNTSLVSILESLSVTASIFHQNSGVQNYLQEIITQYLGQKCIENNMGAISPMSPFELDHLQGEFNNWSPLYQKLLLGILFQSQFHDDLSIQLKVEQYSRLKHWIERYKPVGYLAILTNLEYRIISSYLNRSIDVDHLLKMIGDSEYDGSVAENVDLYKAVCILIRLIPHQSNDCEILTRLTSKLSQRSQFLIMFQALKQSRFKLLGALLGHWSDIGAEITYPFISQLTSLSTCGNLYQTAYVMTLLEKRLKFFGQSPDRVSQIWAILIECGNLIKSTLKGDRAASIITYWCQKITTEMGIPLPSLLIIDTYLPGILERLDSIMDNSIDYLIDVYRYRNRINQLTVFKTIIPQISQVPFILEINIDQLLSTITEIIKAGANQEIPS